jgi:ribose/xylose/arabinose/galactoside ABC-type transport system permease subunit
LKKEAKTFVLYPGARVLCLAAACLLVGLIATLSSPYFATWENFNTVFRNSAELLFVSLGMTLLLAMGSIDVSVGMAMGLAAIAVGRVVEAGGSPWLAILAGLAVGAMLGLVTGSVIVIGRIPAIVGTLGLLGVYRAAIFLALGGSWLSGLPHTLTGLIGGTLLGIPVAAIVIAAAYAVLWVAMRRTTFGVHLLAIGNSEEKARLAAVAVTRTRLLTFVISGLLCGAAAAFYVSTYRTVEMTIGGDVALEAIAAVVLGGTSILGGRCSLLGTAIGVVLIRILQNGLLLIGVPSLWQTVVTGLLLILILSGEVLGGRLRRARPARAAA